VTAGRSEPNIRTGHDFDCLFTAQMLRVWNEGRFKGNYPGFHQAIVRLIPPTRTPNCFRAGRTRASRSSSRSRSETAVA